MVGDGVPSDTVSTCAANNDGTLAAANFACMPSPTDVRDGHVVLETDYCVKDVGVQDGVRDWSDTFESMLPAVEETNLQNLSCAEHVPRNETQFIVQNRFADPEPVPVVPQIINSTNFDAKVGPLGGSCFKLMSQ